MWRVVDEHGTYCNHIHPYAQGALEHHGLAADGRFRLDSPTRRAAIIPCVAEPQAALENVIVALEWVASGPISHNWSRVSAILRACNEHPEWRWLAVVRQAGLGGGDSGGRITVGRTGRCRGVDPYRVWVAPVDVELPNTLGVLEPSRGRSTANV